MFLVGILSWWYTKGLIRRVQIIKTRLIMSSDMFSILLLLRTLFNPFRQISANDAAVSFADQIKAFFDKLLSRCIGFVVRLFMIFFGLIVLTIQFIFGLLVIIFWLIMPILPVAGMVMLIIGWIPKWQI